jgi:hypothetical protein
VSQELLPGPVFVLHVMTAEALAGDAITAAAAAAHKIASFFFMTAPKSLH